ncbi:hypothetical protein BNATCHR286 (nucleomorph) [Bigelowiella natans]|uniref:Uncharacterized protein n=1 Tax=Bigelowiella natans TaxID=227086 RepID=Q3LWB0_BIGNA|nr:hypothetical protein BNATCHR286 [Bigelowiella natans]ABA27256.1 hypothetical protein [Bigelowiella natans]|mmetsp:Transcript_2135/g.2666  ORF Transcript_2135/g.2666 Transcript_2135/m.2666 type:complete len:254 (-) Transcript_2135:496-1257(-)
MLSSSVPINSNLYTKDSSKYDRKHCKLSFPNIEKNNKKTKVIKYFDDILLHLNSFKCHDTILLTNNKKKYRLKKFIIDSLSNLLILKYYPQHLINNYELAYKLPESPCHSILFLYFIFSKIKFSLDLLYCQGKTFEKKYFFTFFFEQYFINNTPNLLSNLKFMSKIYRFQHTLTIFLEILFDLKYDSLLCKENILKKIVKDLSIYSEVLIDKIKNTYIRISLMSQNLSIYQFLKFKIKKFLLNIYKLYINKFI